MSLPPDISPLFLSKLTNTAILTAQQVGHFLKNAFYTNTCELSYKEEGRHNLVTQYDIQAEALIISSIKKQFPHHSFLGEEGGEKKGASNDILWIIDPIDGTVNFAHGIPFFSVSIAATFQENVLVGVVYSPITEELFVAEKQQGAYLNGSPLKVSSTSLLVDSLLVTGFPYCVQE
ncbi:MAG: inositol monophosphatase, partial [Chlamydiae bacterium]|nr:inositol monophosphatase [Chlamydiota bacterium]